MRLLKLCARGFCTATGLLIALATMAFAMAEVVIFDPAFHLFHKLEWWSGREDEFGKPLPKQDGKS